MSQRIANSVIRPHTRPIVMTDLYDNVDFVRGMVSEARQYDWQVMAFKLSNYIPSNPPPVGAILSGPMNAPIAQYLKDSALPLVILGSKGLRWPGRASVIIPDAIPSGALASVHFAERGFRHVGYIINEPSATKIGRGTFESLKRRATELGLETHLLQYRPTRRGSKSIHTHNSPFMIDAISEWLQRVPKPIGILVSNIRMASRLWRACQIAEFRIPEDVAVIASRDDLAMSELSPVSISAVRMDYSEIGQLTVQKLKDLVDGKPLPQEALLVPPKEIIERQSTNVLAVDDERLAAAIRYLWDNLDEPLTVEDVARDINVPRTTLERLFRNHLGRGINAELRRKRLELCCQLLREDSFSIAEIVQLIGFKSESYLYRAFKKEFDISPNDYRMKHRGHWG